MNDQMLSSFFLIPMSFNLVIIAVCWLFYLAREDASGLRQKRNRIYRCQQCQHVYLDARDVPLARCTRCGMLNEAVKR